MEKERKSKFVENLKERWLEEKFVCVGLDSAIKKIPAHLRRTWLPTEEIMSDFNKEIIEATHDYVCAYKPNIAFYEAQGTAGLRALKKTILYIKDNYKDIPVILDAKRADIGNTNQGYIEAAFNYLEADAITVNPYFGREALKPFLDCQDKGVIVLVKTSNPGASEFQDLLVGQKQEPMWQVVARNVAESWNENGNCAVVVGATCPDELKKVRGIIGDMPILVPGIGKQGGDLEKVVSFGRGKNSWGMIINSSRGIIFASKEYNFAEEAGKKAKHLNEQINNFRQNI
jgi:orotidine-5'-phosphate decarboxylase